MDGAHPEGRHHRASLKGSCDRVAGGRSRWPKIRWRPVGTVFCSPHSTPSPPAHSLRQSKTPKRPQSPDRKNDVEGKGVSVSVDLGGSRTFKKQLKNS